MKLLADECIEASIVQALRSNGFTVEHVSETMRGSSDIEILAAAKREEAILLTSDKDFGEIVYRQGRATNGVILLRLHGLTGTSKTKIILKTLAQYTELHSKFTVVTQTSVRISRPLERNGE